MTAPAEVAELDPFDLPDWVGEAPVAWTTQDGLGGHLVAGCLTGGPDQAPKQTLPCDLLAVDQAYPAPVLEDALRTKVHQAWRHGQVLLLTRDGRATVAAPGTSWSADRVLETFTRVARAVGADPADWSVQLGLSSG